VFNDAAQDQLIEDLVKEKKYEEDVAKERASIRDLWQPRSAACRRRGCQPVRSPEKLWDVYSDPVKARRRMVESAFEAARADISCPEVGEGLSEIQFYRVMSGALNQMPLVRLIEREAETGLDAGKAVELIAAAGGAAPYATEEMREILAAWLQYYFPDRYSASLSTRFGMSRID